MQDRVYEFHKALNIQVSPQVALLDLIAETGEFAQELLKNIDYGNKQIDTKNVSEMQDELGDMIYSLLTLALSLGICADEVLGQTLTKYEKRFKDTGQIGSVK